MAVRMDCFGATHVGRRRDLNQDQFLIADLNKSMQVLQSSVGIGQQTRLFGNSQGKLLLVADGLGGQNAGERASTLAVDGVVEYILNTMPWLFRLDGEGEREVLDHLKAGLKHCQEAMAREAEAIPQRSSMGTTLTMAYLIWPRVYVVHVGDSRCWLLRDGKLNQLTRDHTLHQLYQESRENGGHGGDQFEAGQDEQSERARNVLWSAITADKDMNQTTVDVHHQELHLGDTLLLCTDGLYKELSTERIQALLGTDADARTVCEQLIQQANTAGGSDNITAIVARFCEPCDTSPCLEADAEVDESEPVGTRTQVVDEGSDAEVFT